jgi:hypothetical protein
VGLAQTAQAAYAQAKAALVTIEQGHERWRGATVTLMDALHRGREVCQGDDRAFGDWLKGKDLSHISPDDREALINMARHREVTVEVLAKTKKTSWQNVWRFEVKPQVKPQVKPAPAAKGVPEPSTVGGTVGGTVDVQGFRADWHAQDIEYLKAKHVKETEALKAAHVKEIEALKAAQATDHFKSYDRGVAAGLRQAASERERLEKALCDKVVEKLAAKFADAGIADPDARAIGEAALGKGPKVERVKTPVFSEAEIKRLRKALHPDGKPADLVKMFDEASALFNARAELLVKAAKRRR